MKHTNVDKELLIMDSHGNLIPNKFITDYTNNLCDENGDELTGSILADIEMLKNPDNILYWEAWSNVLENVYIYKETHNGMSNELYSLHHHNNLWAIKVDDLNKLNESESKLFWETI